MMWNSGLTMRLARLLWGWRDNPDHRTVSLRELAQRLNDHNMQVGHATLARWELGKDPLPQDVARTVEDLSGLNFRLLGLLAALADGQLHLLDLHFQGGQWTVRMKENT